MPMFAVPVVIKTEATIMVEAEDYYKALVCSKERWEKEGQASLELSETHVDFASGDNLDEIVCEDEFED